MANIYQLSEALQACIKLDEQRMVDTDTGEILDVDQYLDMAETLDTKLENLALYIKNQQAEADMIKAEADKLAERAAVEKRDVSFQMVIDDVYAIGRGRLVGRPTGK